MSSMASCRRLLVVCLLLASLHTFMQPANGQPLVLTVGQGGFSTVQQAVNAVPVNNKGPVVINVQPGTYRLVIY